MLAFNIVCLHGFDNIQRRFATHVSFSKKRDSVSAHRTKKNATENTTSLLSMVSPHLIVICRLRWFYFPMD